MGTRSDILDRINPKRDKLDSILTEEYFQPIQKVDGTWITTKEEWSRLYQSVADIEKYLRS